MAQNTTPISWTRIIAITLACWATTHGILLRIGSTVGVKLYHPFKIFEWIYRYNIPTKWLIEASILFLIVLIPAIYISSHLNIFKVKKTKSDLYGSAEWMDKTALKKINMIQRPRIFTRIAKIITQPINLILIPINIITNTLATPIQIIKKWVHKKTNISWRIIKAHDIETQIKKLKKITILKKLIINLKTPIRITCEAISIIINIALTPINIITNTLFKPIWWKIRNHKGDLPSGIIVGQTYDAKYKQKGLNYKMKQPGELIVVPDTTPEHAILYAPTRSGKGVGVIIPTLLAWEHSTFVVDMKGEAYNNTSGYREKRLKNDIIAFRPYDRKSNKYNPLMEITKENAILDARVIVNALVTANTQQDTHWTKSATTFITAAILYVLHHNIYHKKTGDLMPKSLGTINYMFKAYPAKELAQMLKNNQAEDPDVRMQIYEEGKQLENKGAGDELSSVISTVCTYLNTWDVPQVKHNTDTSDFSIRSLVYSKKPQSMYLIIPGPQLPTARVIVRIMMDLVGIALASTEEDEADAKSGRRHKLLMAIDEFPQMKKIDILKTNVAYHAGYGIKYLFVAQNRGQVAEEYGKQNAINNNSKYQIFLGMPNDMADAKDLEESIGKTTIQVSTSQSKNIDKSKAVQQSGSETLSIQGRSLMTAQEIIQKPYPEFIMIIQEIGAIKGKKIMHYQDERFRSKASMKPAKLIYRDITKENIMWNETTPIDNPEEEIEMDISSIASGIDSVNMEDNEEDEIITKETIVKENTDQEEENIIEPQETQLGKDDTETQEQEKIQREKEEQIKQQEKEQEQIQQEKEEQIRNESGEESFSTMDILVSAAEKETAKKE